MSNQFHARHALCVTRRTARPGFTILELMIVIVIIGVLGGIVGINLIGAADRAKKEATLASMRTIRSALTAYKVEKNKYPTTGEGLQVLITESRITSINDGWGNPMGYRSPVEGHAYVILSAGKDGDPDTLDDNISTFPETNE